MDISSDSSSIVTELNNILKTSNDYHSLRLSDHNERIIYSQSSSLESTPQKSVSPKKSICYSYDDSFVTLNSSYNSDESWIKNLNPSLLQKIKQNDYMKYVEIKCKLDHRNEISKTQENIFSQKQIKNHIFRVINSSKISPLSEAPVPTFNVKSEVINRLKAKNMIKNIKDEQNKKIDNLGNDIGFEFLRENSGEVQTEKSLEELAEKVYYKKKCDRIRSRLVEDKFVEHNAFYTDSVLLIGHLAATMPKHSENSEYVFSQLLKPLSENKRM